MSTQTVSKFHRKSVYFLPKRFSACASMKLLRKSCIFNKIFINYVKTMLFPASSVQKQKPKHQGNDSLFSVWLDALQINAVFILPRRVPLLVTYFISSETTTNSKLQQSTIYWQKHAIRRRRRGGGIANASRLCCRTCSRDTQSWRCSIRWKHSHIQCDSNSPVFDIFYNQEGSQSIFNMKNLTAREFQCLWDLVADHVMSYWNIGRGKRCTYGGKDVLLMMLATLKHGSNWDWTGKIFGVKGPTFERMIVKYVNIVSEYLYNYLVETEARRFSLSDIEEKGKGFHHYPFAKYATDVTFQQSNRPLGNHQESKVYFSGKHKLYGYKCEVWVLPIGIACHATGHFLALLRILIYFLNITNNSSHLREKQKRKRTTKTTIFMLINTQTIGQYCLIRATKAHLKWCAPFIHQENRQWGRFRLNRRLKTKE